MVLTRKVGKERSFVGVLFLGIVTFGIYYIVWHWKAHDEVFKQFELDREGKSEGIVWLILGMVLIQPLLWVYQYMFVSNVRYVAERLGSKRGVSAGGFLGLTIPGMIVFTVGFALTVFGAIALGAEAGEPPQAPMSEQEAEDSRALGKVLLPIGLVLAVAGAAMAITAYARLQAAINAIWRGYDQRIARFNPPSPAAGAPTPTAPAGWGQAPQAPQSPGPQRPW